MITRWDYTTYLICTPLNYTCSNLAEHHAEAFSHDVVTDYLCTDKLTGNHLWEYTSGMLIDTEDSFLIVDDSVQNKQYSQKIELVKRQYSGATGGLVRGIGIVNLVHTNGHEDFNPIDFRVYAKDFDGKTKNDHFREMLIQAVANKQVKARNILFDSWYASAENLKLVESLGFTFYTTLKSNRLICREGEIEKYHLQGLKWTEEEEKYGIRIKVSKIPFTVRLFKLVAKNGDIDWIITNDFDLMSTAEVVQKADKVRWEIEQFHRELKQLTGSEKCQCRKQRSQRNHLANCYHAWLTLKRKARETGQTVYALKNGLLKEYLKQEMATPRIPAYQVG